jgi:hypothetical protein
MKQMRLYQHSAHCPVALQLFLQHNPMYQCFIPKSMNEVEDENQFYLENLQGIDIKFNFHIEKNSRDHHKVAEHLTYVPSPPAGYGFSYLQLHEQRLFFDRFLSRPIDQLPYKEVDLYRMKTIAVCK